MKSKEDKVLELFFNKPKHWHFDELHKKSGLSRDRLSYWLKKFIKQGLIKRVKPKGKMPYYRGIYSSPEFLQKKKLFGIKQLTDCGLLTHLSSLASAKVVIIFGSFSRGDWYDHSDVDVFIYGDANKFDYHKYGFKLNRQIQIHNAKDSKDLKRIDKIIPYILEGEFIKGSIQDLGVKIEA